MTLNADEFENGTSHFEEAEETERSVQHYLDTFLTGTHPTQESGKNFSAWFAAIHPDPFTVKNVVVYLFQTSRFPFQYLAGRGTLEIIWWFNNRIGGH